MAHLSDDKTVAKMGHPVLVVVRSDVGPPSVDRVFLSIWRVNKPDDPVLSMALVGVFETSWIQLAPWYRQLDPILRNALAYQKLFDPLRSS
jgi:hypothetical protein